MGNRISKVGAILVVEGEPSLNGTESENIVSELDAYIRWLEEKQPEIENATTKKNWWILLDSERSTYRHIRGGWLVKK
jgi:hypothetical protein